MAEERPTSALVEEFRRRGIARSLRLMAAQGRFPLKPEDLLELWTDLAVDPDDGVRAAAEKSLSTFPATELQPILESRDTPSRVLFWVAAHRPEQELRAVALQNHSLTDEAIEVLAPSLTPDLAELVVINQTRLLRRTSLLVALESNPGLSKDQKRRLRELRETSGIPEAAVAPPARALPPARATPRPEPGPEAEMEADTDADLAPVEHVFMTEDEALVRYLSEEERQQTDKVSVVQKLCRLNTAEKLIAALTGTREERAILIRDPDRLVGSAVLSSPRITEPEIETISGMRSVSGEILRKIGNHREWTKRYSVIKSLVCNPRTPIDIALTLAPRINPRDVKALPVARRLPDPKGPSPVTSRELELLGFLAWLTVRAKRLLGELESALEAELREGILATIQRAEAALARDRLGEVNLSVEEMREAVQLLGRWLAPSVQAVEGELGGDEQRRILDVIEVERPRAFVREMHTAERLLERGSKGERDSQGAPFRARVGEQPPDHEPRDGWSADAVDLYAALVRGRLAESACSGCGGSLRSARVSRTNTCAGTLINEFQLSDRGMARLLAATDELDVTCDQCGARNVVPGEGPETHVLADAIARLRRRRRRR